MSKPRLNLRGETRMPLAWHLACEPPRPKRVQPPCTWRTSHEAESDVACRDSCSAAGRFAGAGTNWLLAELAAVESGNDHTRPDDAASNDRIHLDREPEQQ